MNTVVQANPVDFGLQHPCARMRDYIELCKPRVVLLMILTSMVGMALVNEHRFSWMIFLWGNLGIALLASSAAALNHLVDRHLDQLMHRTKNRPIVSGKVSTKNGAIFATILCVVGLLVLITRVNWFAALLTLL